MCRAFVLRLYAFTIKVGKSKHIFSFMGHPRPKNKLSLRIGRKKDLEKLSIAFVKTYGNPVVPIAVFIASGWLCGEALLVIG